MVVLGKHASPFLRCKGFHTFLCRRVDLGIRELHEVLNYHSIARFTGQIVFTIKEDSRVRHWPNFSWSCCSASNVVGPGKSGQSSSRLTCDHNHFCCFEEAMFWINIIEFSNSRVMSSEMKFDSIVIDRLFPIALMSSSITVLQMDDSPVSKNI